MDQVIDPRNAAYALLGRKDPCAVQALTPSALSLVNEKNASVTRIFTSEGRA
jgi:hypothetical protein